MSDNVAVSTSVGGATIAAEDIGGVEYQRVKLVAGNSGVSTPISATSGVPAAGSIGIIVAVKPGVSVSAQVSGNVTVAGVVTIDPTTLTVNTGAAYSTVGISGGSVTVAGTAVVTLATGGTVATLLGAVLVSISAVPATTAAPSISATGIPMWIVGGQSTTAFPVVITGTVAAGAGTTVVSVTGTAIVTLATGGTIATLLGTVAVTDALAVYTTAITVTSSATVLGVVLKSGALVGISTVLTPMSITGTSINVVVSGIVTVNTAAAYSTVGISGGSVSIAGTAIVTLATGGTIATLLGTLAVTDALAAYTTAITVTSSATVLGVVFKSGAIVGLSALPAAGSQVTVTSGLPVWLAPTQTINATVNTGPAYSTVGISGGSVTVAGTAIVTLATGGTLVTILGTLAVTDALAAYTTAITVTSSATVLGVVFKSGAIVGLSALPPAGSQVTVTSGLPVWLAPTQTILATVNTAAAVSTVGISGGSVSIAGLVLVSISALPLAGSQVTVTSGLGVWLAPTQTVTVNTIAAGFSVNVGTVANVVVTGTQVATAGMIVWLAPTQTMNIAVATTAVATTTQAQATGAIVWFGPTQTIQLSGIAATTTASGLSGVTGLPVWLANPTAVNATVTITGLTFAGGYWNAVNTSTAISSSTQIMLMSVYNSTGSTLATSGWTIGPSSALVIYGIGFGWSQAAANMQVTLMVVVTNTGATLSTGMAPANVWADVTFSTAVALSTFISTNWTPGSLVAANSSITTIPFPWVIAGPAVVGLAVAATASGATVYASIQGQIVNTMLPVMPVTVSGSVVISGVAVATTTQVAVTGVNVWLSPTQTMAAVSTVATVLGTVSVSMAGTPGYIPFFAMVTVTSSIIPPTTVIFTVWTGITQAAAGVGVYVVPVGKTLRVQVLQVIVASSAVVQVNRYAILASTGTPTMTSTVGVVAAIGIPLTVTTQYLLQDLIADIPPGVTVGFGIDVGNTRHQIVGINIAGFLF